MKIRAHPKLSLWLVLLIVLFGVACTMHGWIYNLTTGEVTPVDITYGGSGRRKISGIVASCRLAFHLSIPILELPQIKLSSPA